MSLSCARAARGSRWPRWAVTRRESERLELEAHLAACARCSAEHADLAAVRALRTAEPEGLSTAARERVRRAALAGAVRAPLAAPRRLWPVGFGAALALAGAAAVLFMAAGRPTRRAVVSGDVDDRAGSPSARDGAIVSARRAAARSAWATRRPRWPRGPRSSGGAPRAAWSCGEGSVTIDVEHQAGQHFQVRTPRFVVEVIGTRFTVDLGGVRTERGTVRVFGLDGALWAR